MQLAIVVAWIAISVAWSETAFSQSTWKVLYRHSNDALLDIQQISRGQNTLGAVAIKTVRSPFSLSIVYLRSTDMGESWNQLFTDIPTTIASFKLIRICQIDDFHAIIGGASGLLFTTADGGLSWHTLPLPSSGLISDISFSDSVHGVISVRDSFGVYETSDGGVNWRTPPIARPWLMSAESYSSVRYSAFLRGTGPFYWTADDWADVDSSKLLPLRTEDSATTDFFRCTFAGSDTLLAFGSLNGGTAGVLCRSIDLGKTWSRISVAACMSGISDATSLNSAIGLAIGQLTFDSVLLTTDRGSTWKSEFLGIRDGNSQIAWVRSAIRLQDGILAVLDASPTLGYGIIAFRPDLQSSVAAFERIIYGANLVPNPAGSAIRVANVDVDGTLELFDMTGRLAAKSRVSDSDGIVCDVSHLPTGVYLAQLLYHGYLLPLKPVCILH